MQKEPTNVKQLKEGSCSSGGGAAGPLTARLH